MTELRSLLHNLLLANRVSIHELKRIESRDAVELLTEETDIEAELLRRRPRRDTLKNPPTNPRSSASRHRGRSISRDDSGLTTERAGRRMPTIDVRDPPLAFNRTRAQDGVEGPANESILAHTASTVPDKRFVVLSKISREPVKAHPEDALATDVGQDPKHAAVRIQAGSSSHDADSKQAEHSQEEATAGEQSSDVESWTSDQSVHQAGPDFGM